MVVEQIYENAKNASDYDLNQKHEITVKDKETNQQQIVNGKILSGKEFKMLLDVRRE